MYLGFDITDTLSGFRSAVNELCCFDYLRGALLYMLYPDAFLAQPAATQAEPIDRFSYGVGEASSHLTSSSFFRCGDPSSAPLPSTIASPAPDMFASISYTDSDVSPELRQAEIELHCHIHSLLSDAWKQNALLSKQLERVTTSMQLIFKSSV